MDPSVSNLRQYEPTHKTAMNSNVCFNWGLSFTEKCVVRLNILLLTKCGAKVAGYCLRFFFSRFYGPKQSRGKKIKWANSWRNAKKNVVGI